MENTDVADSGRPSRRMRLAVVLAVVYIDMLGLGLAYPILPKLIEQFEHGNTSSASYYYGLVACTYAAMQFLFAPFLGALADRYGRRPVILFALLGMATNYVFIAFAPSLIWLVVGRMVAGCMGATFSPATAYVADITEPERRAQSFGLIGAAFGLGFITGPAIGGFLGAVDLRLPFLAAGGLSLLNFFFGWFALVESLPPERRKPFALSRANPIGALREIGRYPAVVGLLVVFSIAQFANRTGESIWVLYTSYRFGWGPLEVGVSLTALGVVYAVGQAGVTRIMIPALGERRAILLGLCVSALVCIGYGLVPTGWMIYPLMVFILFGWTVAQPAVQALMSRAVPMNEQGLLQGALSSLNNLTNVAGPPFWTALFGYSISPRAPLVDPGAAFFLAAFVFFLAFAIAWRWLAAPARIGIRAQEA